MELMGGIFKSLVVPDIDEYEERPIFENTFCDCETEEETHGIFKDYI